MRLFHHSYREVSIGPNNWWVHVNLIHTIIESGSPFKNFSERTGCGFTRGILVSMQWHQRWKWFLQMDIWDVSKTAHNFHILPVYIRHLYAPMSHIQFSKQWLSLRMHECPVIKTSQGSLVTSVFMRRVPEPPSTPIGQDGAKSIAAIGRLLSRYDSCFIMRWQHPHQSIKILNS